MNTRINFDGKIFEKQSHGGISRVFLQLLWELADYPDLEPILHLKSNVKAPEFPNCIKILSKPKTRNFRPARLFGKYNSFRANHALKKHYRSNGRGIFHSTYYSVSPDPLLKQVFTLHDMMFEDYPEYFPDDFARIRHITEKKECIEQADVIVCDSEYTKERLEAHYPTVIEKKKVKVIHLAAFEPVSELRTEGTINIFREYDPYILHVGARHRHKNFRGLMLALQQPELSELNLLSIGGGEITDREKELISESNAGARVKIIPQVSDHELVDAYLNASVVAVPSITEGFGLPLLEALRFGCSVASSNGGSLPEVGGDAPIYFNPLNLEEMASAIAKAYDLKGSAVQRELAVERAKAFSWQKCTRAYVEIYRKLNSKG